MGYVNTPAGQINGVVPDANEDPNLAFDLLAIAKAIEKRLVGVYSSTADRDAKTSAAGVQEGMFAFTTDTDSFWYRSASAWVSFPPPTPSITSGSAAPSGGSNGDVYFRV